jgi:uncharacterized YigZ family protein
LNRSADTYFTLSIPSESLYKVKGSKHFGFAYPVQTEEQIKRYLEELRKTHHTARHHCYAWRLGASLTHFRANDDGEPSNSAGKPILGQIQSFELTDVLIVVVRYFGGTKLGVGGLIDAYRTAARMAIEAGEITERQVMTSLTAHFPYPLLGGVMKVLKDFNLELGEHQFEMECSVRVSVPRADADRVRVALEDAGAAVKQV